MYTMCLFYQNQAVVIVYKTHLVGWNHHNEILGSILHLMQSSHSATHVSSLIIHAQLSL